MKVVNCPTAKGSMEGRIRQMGGWPVWKLIKVSCWEKQTQKQHTLQNPAWNCLSQSILSCGQVASHLSWVPESCWELCSSASQQTVWKGRWCFWEVWKAMTQDLWLVFDHTVPFKNKHLIVKSNASLGRDWRKSGSEDTAGKWKLQCWHHRQLLMHFSRA